MKIYHPRLRTRGHGLFRQEWYSICSAHARFDPTCDCCQAGDWVNVWTRAADHVVYWFCYPIWHWWHNRPNSASRRRLEGWFPGLRGKDAAP